MSWPARADRPRSRVVPSLLLGLGLLGGCAPASDPPGPGPGETVFLFGRGGDSVDLDPGRANDGESINVLVNIFDTLIQFGLEDCELEPGLAERWEVAEDGKTWTFHLRPGVRFHDGTPCDAEAVVFSFQRQYDPAHPFHEVGGAYKYWQNMGMSDLVEAVETVDADTVRFRLTRMEATFAANLAMHFASIVSPTAVERWGADFGAHPVGTGPFRFQEWRRRERIVLQAHPDYWGGAPAVDRVIIRAIPDHTARLLAYKSGQIHGFSYPNPFDLAAIRALPNTQVLVQQGMNVAYLAMNTQKPPFTDQRVRRAINHAVNREPIIRDLYQNLAVAATTPLPRPPAIWGTALDLPTYAYDPERARTLLAEAGYPDGFKTTVWAMTVPRPYMPSGEKVAEAIIADLARVGVQARMVTYDWATYLDKTDHGEHDMALLGWSGDNGDPDNFLWLLLSAEAAAVPATNIAFWKHPQVHRWLLAARQTLDRAERERLYRLVQETWHEEAPWVPLVHAQQLAVVRGDVEGFFLHPTTRKSFRTVRFRSPSDPG